MTKPKPTVHPLILMALAPFTAHEAYGRCSAGHVLGRYDDPEACPACRLEALAPPVPVSHRTTVLGADGGEVEVTEADLPRYASLDELLRELAKVPEGPVPDDDGPEAA